MDNNSVKQNISKVRKSLKLSQEAMANRLGISRIAYRNIENGNTKLISNSLDKISKIANISKEELVLGYKPVDENQTGLGDMRCRYENKIESLRKELEEKIAKLSSDLEAERKLNKALNDVIRAKDDIIRMQDSMLGRSKK